MAGRKIFISYKYADSNVEALPDIAGPYARTTARHYVDLLQQHLDFTDHINKGEDDGESLAHFKESTIASKLRAKIYDSSVTIVLLSPFMKDAWPQERDQWIPWEIAYSLRVKTRSDRTSSANAMLAVVLPDAWGSYTYAVIDDACPTCHYRQWQTQNYFQILGTNMFNRKAPNYAGTCALHPGMVLGNDHSYIYPIKWVDFAQNVNRHLDIACAIRDDIDAYELRKTP